MVLTNSLLNGIRDDVKDDLELQLAYGALGTDGTSPAATDTALGSEVFEDSVDEFDKTSETDKVTVSFRVLTTEANGNTIKEVGFKAASGGTVKIRNTPAEISKTSDIQLYFDGEITILVEEG